MTDQWRDEFVLDRLQRDLGARGRLRRQVRSGELVRVARGVYHAPVPANLSPRRAADASYLTRVRAAQLANAEPIVLWGRSAAAAWSLPAVDPWPEAVHVVVERASGGRSNTTLQRHAVGLVEPVQVGGLLATTLARTVVDIARSASLREAVVVADAALHGLRAADGRTIRAPLAKDELLAELARAGSGQGVVQARLAVEIADGASGSVGESCSRVGFHLLGLPAPELQVTFYDRLGKIGTVDFWWPEFKLIGEFDGFVKYEEPAFLKGRMPQQALRDEKVREDRLRKEGRNLTRWGWSTALSLPALRAHLAEAGIR